LNIASPISFEINQIIKILDVALGPLDLVFKENTSVTNRVFDVSKMERLIKSNTFSTLNNALNMQISFMRKTLYFDLDGTLLNVNLRLYKVHQIAAQEVYSSYIPFKKYLSAKKNKIDEEILMSSFSTDLKFVKYNQIRMESIEKMEFLLLDTLRGGVLETLNYLKSRGYCLNLITARKNHQNINVQLENLKIKHLFSSILLSEKNVKTVIDGFTQGIFFTDTDEDIRFGVNQQVYTVGVLGGMRSKCILEKAGPQLLCKSIPHAVAVLGL
jgi:phosphoglycolate phosphatase-like HAD superfamily hydrolase